MDLQQFGVIPFEIRTLKKRHTEKWRSQRFYIAEIVRHRGTVGAWRNRGYLRVLFMFLSTSFTKQWFARSIKTFINQSFQQHVHYGSVALCAFGTSVILSLLFHLRVLPLSVCLLYVVGLLYHSIFRKKQVFCSLISLCFALMYEGL